MNVLIYVGHPAQYLFFRPTIQNLHSHRHQVLLLIKTKDVLETLVKQDGIAYQNIQERPRKNNLWGIILGLVKRNWAVYKQARRFKPDLMLGSDASLAQVGWLLRIPRVTVLEDDYSVIKNLALLTFPFSSFLLVPACCDVGSWKHKKLGYRGYMKLAYLHPDTFRPDAGVLERYGLQRPFVLIRLAQLTAHHDFGAEGISASGLDRLIDLFRLRGLQVWISAEGEIAANHQSHLLQINPSDLHSIFSYATLLVSDSQSMSVEASMLGIPSIRISSFSGEISVLEELEHRYRLTFGFKPREQKRYLRRITSLLDLPDLEATFQQRRAEMLAEKIKVSQFFTWFIEHYPESARRLQADPEFQDSFR
jgi:uncharacterized protein